MTQPQPLHRQHSVVASGKRIAFIQSGWHADIVDEARKGFFAEMVKHGVPETLIDRFEVPGAFEIPLQAKLLAKTWGYAAIVAAGFVVDGGIYRHEFVAGAVIDALMRVQLDTEVPVISVVLTPQHFHEHFQVKGREVAKACTETIASLERLPVAA